MKKKTEKIVSDGKALTTNPFAALVSLQNQLPLGDKTIAPEAKSASPKPSPFAALGKVVVKKERKGHGGKTVTLVQGLSRSLLESTCAEMKKALGCGARVEEDLVVLQGEQVDRACTWLTQKGVTKIVRGS